MQHALHAVLLVLGLGSAACADLAGIEAGRLSHANGSGAGASGMGSLAGAGSGLDAGTANGGSGPLAGAGAGNPNVGGTAAGGAQPAAGAGSPSGGATGSGATGGAGNASGASPSGAGGAGGAGKPCPDGMVESASSQNDGYCIDAFEVTNAEYLAFTQAHSAASTAQAGACSGNDSFLPSSSCASALNDVPSKNVPVVCVDWCDAQAYCTSLGKRLCGRIGGGENPQSDSADDAACEWYAACAGPDSRAVSGSNCNGAGFDSNATHPKTAAQIPDCEGGVPGAQNLSGNVAEWENSCDSPSASGNCNTRGGSYQDGPYELECASSNAAPRKTQSATIGIRCCADQDL